MKATIPTFATLPNVVPEPPSKLDAGIVELAQSIPVRLEALYEGEDPFSVADEDEVEAQAKPQANNREKAAYRRARAYS